MALSSYSAARSKSANFADLPAASATRMKLRASIRCSPILTMSSTARFPSRRIALACSASCSALAAASGARRPQGEPRGFGLQQPG
jgi:hypothetical protein